MTETNQTQRAAALTEAAAGGARPPPSGKSPRFQIEDIERLFKALVPSGSPDPFGRLEQLLLELGEEDLEATKETGEFRDRLFDQLGDIKSRTFGILFLQILKTLKLFFGFLPQGRIILIIIAGLAIALPLIQGQGISLQEVRNAVAKTGLADFLDSVMAELREQVEQIAGTASLLADTSSVAFVQLGGAIEIMAQDISRALGNVETLVDLEGDELSSGARGALNALGFNLGEALRKADSTGNIQSNLEHFIGPALRKLGGSIRTIPALASHRSPKWPKIDSPMCSPPRS